MKRKVREEDEKKSLKRTSVRKWGYGVCGNESLGKRWKDENDEEIDGSKRNVTSRRSGTAVLMEKNDCVRI